MEWLERNENGVLVKCKVQPSASKTAMVGVHDGRLKISLAAPPVDGKANKALRTFIAKKLSIPKSKVELVAGEKSRTKNLACTGTTIAAAGELLAPDD